MTLLKATEYSINTPYVELGLTIGPEQVKRAAIRAGVPRDTVGLNADPTTVLGTSSPTALDMAHAYSTFAARGERAELQMIKSVKTPDRETDYEMQVDTVQEFDVDVMDNVNYALQQVVNVGTGRTALGLGRPSAGKTGTTDNNMSAWYVGYTPQLATAVMMAKSDANGNMVTLEGTGGLSSVTGGSFPAQMWTAYMTGALEGQPVETFPFPGTWIDGGETGLLSPSASASATATAEPSFSPSEEVTGGSTQSPEPDVTSQAPVEPTVVPTTPDAVVTPSQRVLPEPSGVAATGSPVVVPGTP